MYIDLFAQCSTKNNEFSFEIAEPKVGESFRVIDPCLYPKYSNHSRFCAAIKDLYTYYSKDQQKTYLVSRAIAKEIGALEGLNLADLFYAEREEGNFLIPVNQDGSEHSKSLIKAMAAAQKNTIKRVESKKPDIFEYVVAEDTMGEWENPDCHMPFIDEYKENYFVLDKTHPVYLEMVAASKTK